MREAATGIMEVAKRIDCAVILVGHVTKEGAVAGPRVLEHLVDCVLFFEGERERSFRTLRALKNRFGATSEVGVFEMRSGGLVEVDDPSARFVAEASAAPGSVVLCSMEGTRPLLVEVQALVAPTEIVPPRRVATGIDRNRLAMVLAVLARHGGPSLAGADVFVNVAGGVRIDEPGADLAVALALVSAHRGERARRRGVAGRSPASARSGSPASCARSATPTAGSPRRSSSASARWSPPRRPRRSPAWRRRRRARRDHGRAAGECTHGPRGVARCFHTHARVGYRLAPAVVRGLGGSGEGEELVPSCRRGPRWRCAPSAWPPPRRSSPPPSGGFAAKLGPGVSVSHQSETGSVGFIGTRAGTTIPSGVSASASPESAARAFVSRYAGRFGLADRSARPAGREHRRRPRPAAPPCACSRPIAGLPVLGGQLAVVVDGSNRVLSVLGETSPSPRTDTDPRGQLGRRGRRSAGRRGA